LIHPSLREGWGINVIEANAMGTPALGYHVHGLRDSIVNGETGLLCSAGRPESLASAAISLLQTPERYRYLQHGALQWSRQFTWPIATSRSLALVDAIGSKRRRPTNSTCGGTGKVLGKDGATSAWK
jgi:glycosyltransferase involved in cell wall biosynthesis